MLLPTDAALFDGKKKDERDLTWLKRKCNLLAQLVYMG